MILRKIWGGNTLIPLYDNEDAVCGIIYNNAAYYFQKNLQGDIIALTNHYGAVQVRYTYDAWGVPTVSYDITPAQIGNINPFRYRGYYYDPEIGMYYLQSRYYDPTVGRFINADKQVCCWFLGMNLFCYCEDSTVNSLDPDGMAARVVIDPGHGGSSLGAKGSRLESVRVGRYGMWVKTIKYYYEKTFNLNVSLELKRLLWSAGYKITLTRSSDVEVSLKTRYTIANNIKANVFVSIHHNSIHPTKNTELAVLNGTKMPAVLVECGYMSNDLQYCRDNYKKIAYAIYRGILNYFA